MTNRKLKKIVEKKLYDKYRYTKGVEYKFTRLAKAEGKFKKNALVVEVNELIRILPKKIHGRVMFKTEIKKTENKTDMNKIEDFNKDMSYRSFDCYIREKEERYAPLFTPITKKKVIAYQWREYDRKIKTLKKLGMEKMVVKY